jgi:hypothetical protein
MYYIAHDTNAIYGVGTTPGDALNDASEHCDDIGPLTVTRCTRALYLEVLDMGGAIGWGEKSDNIGRTVACTLDEEDAALGRVTEY